MIKKACKITKHAGASNCSTSLQISSNSHKQQSKQWWLRFNLDPGVYSLDMLSVCAIYLYNSKYNTCKPSDSLLDQFQIEFSK